MSPALALIVAAIPFLAPSRNDDIADEIQGAWIVVEAERGGESSESPIGDVLTFDGSEVVIEPDEASRNKQTASYTLETSKDPVWIELKPDDTGGDETVKVLGLVKIEDGKLTMIFSAPGEERPSEFRTESGGSQMMAVLKKKDD